MTITASKLRADIYKLLDSAISSGKPLEIKRKNEILHIVPERKASKLDNITAKKISNISDEELIYHDWEKDWKPSF